MIEPTAHARSTDPDTSQEAADSITDITARQNAILQVMHTANTPVTDWQLAELYNETAGVPPQSDSGLRTRRSELVRLGRVRDSGGRMPLPSGRHGIVWELVPDSEIHMHASCPPRRTDETDQLCLQWMDAVEAGDSVAEATLEEYIELRSGEPPKLGQAAVWYAHQGWPVFPLKQSSKVPATRNGFYDATTDVERIRRYWKMFPHCNIGLATGHLFDVVDLDTPISITSLSKVLADHDIYYGQVVTASGGMHLYTTPSGRGNLARWMPGIDYRGRGGYVVAPPSTLGAGRNWTWLVPPSDVILGGS